MAGCQQGCRGCKRCRPGRVHGPVPRSPAGWPAAQRSGSFCGAVVDHARLALVGPRGSTPWRYASAGMGLPRLFAPTPFSATLGAVATVNPPATKTYATPRNVQKPPSRWTRFGGRPTMHDDKRCCGTGTCIIDGQGHCWCGQQWDGVQMCRPTSADASALQDHDTVPTENQADRQGSQ